MRTAIIDAFEELLAILIAVAAGATMFYIPPLLSAIGVGAVVYYWLKH